ncbi:GTP cyclohydrolase II [Roseateles amylovorans]|jgi:GTP cyclohydrolase II|uniref:GTP cyclohydrolase-2 n=1 Tax=Roseateles amylovorans TaxID=2978473 RepID=A0ABY6B4W1_9BURK|nr:GTP cyclohydrolase II [Roseateles amylovorans]UXH78305.1 GTP cyclohydrolase II [Roseateles amylovorans]
MAVNHCEKIPLATQGATEWEVVQLPSPLGDFEARAFRSPTTGSEHLVLSVGPIRPRGGLLRIHSECLTGDVFKSLRCDCGPQLEEALKLLSADGGVVIYMRGHEGRGIGLVEKLRAYALQEAGVDTIDANLQLGHAEDARDYADAIDILCLLGIQSVRLITNNPQKRDALVSHGIEVEALVPVRIAANPHNERYLETKRKRMGHYLE